MNLGFPAQEWPARNVLIAVSHCAKIMPSRVERVSRFSARPAVFYIEHSTPSPRMGNVGSEKEPSSFSEQEKLPDYNVGMQTPVGEHIRSLEEQLKLLNAEVMDNAKGRAERNRIEAEIRAVTLALSHYRAAIELERNLIPLGRRRT
jgi:hypothetical protein